jgi:deoxyinosine 3'endonuclease (endonuclease V)
MANASGRDHPRGAGLALHLGAVLDQPSVGVTDRPLLATGQEPGVAAAFAAEYRSRAASGAGSDAQNPVRLWAPSHSGFVSDLPHRHRARDLPGRM